MSLWKVPENFYQHNKINKDEALRTITFPIFRVPSKSFKVIMNIFKKYSPDLMNFDNILKYPETNDYKGIVLDPSTFPNISSELLDKQSKVLTEMNCEFSNDNIEYHDIKVTYDNYKLSTLIEWLLPEENQLSGFTIVGHIVHINLKEELSSFKYVIGELMLDKIPHAKCIVSKVNKIDSEFRTFELDLLAGEPDYVTTIKEHGFTFSFDFSKVYWNSRLGTEHSRVVDSLKSTDIVYDACAGVGPFAIPAAKKGCRTVANDLNGESCKWFRKNIQLNSTKRNPLSIDLHNLDAAEFIGKTVIPDIIRCSAESKESSRFFLIMNLPSIAVKFLSSIVADKTQLSLIEKTNVLLHVRCYCFIGKESPRETIEAEIHRQLGSAVEHLHLRMVRNVAPSKDMFCAEITVNLSPAKVDDDSGEIIDAKRAKLENGISE